MQNIFLTMYTAVVRLASYSVINMYC